MSDKILLSWSGGKDSAMTLFEIAADPRYEVAGLLTTLTEEYDRISMHGVRRTLLERQAELLGLPLHKVYIPPDAGNGLYESRMAEALELNRAAGVNLVAFGDLFLADIKQYRQEQLSRLSMSGVFPLWMRDTGELVRQFIRLGFKAIVTCIDSQALDSSFAGCLIDDEFLSRLPPRVDPCGENGEFHSFVFDGPIFKEKVKLSIGPVVQRDRFWFRDLIGD